MARNKIDDVTKYDFINDYSGTGEIYTYGNYMCSSYDYSDEFREELKEKTKPYMKELREDKWCSYIFSELEIGAD